MTSAAILGLGEVIGLLPQMISTWNDTLGVSRRQLYGDRPAFASSPAAATIVKKDRLYTASIELIWLCLSSSPSWRMHKQSIQRWFWPISWQSNGPLSFSVRVIHCQEVRILFPIPRDYLYLESTGSHCIKRSSRRSTEDPNRCNNTTSSYISQGKPFR